jgi:hypothetical protein
MSNKVRRAIQNRDRCFKKFQKTRRGQDKLYHIVARHEVNRLKREAKHRYEENVVSSLSNENLNPRKFWSLSKSVLGVNCDWVIPPLKYNNCFISEDIEKAETFNQYFAKQMSINNNIADLPTLPPFLYITGEWLGSVDVNEPGNEADVLRYLRQVNIHKSYGLDGISNHILKFCADSLYKPLTKLFSFSLLNGKYPSQWKISNVCPVYKQKGDKRDISNYRPIVLLSTISKIFENVIYKSLYEFCVLHNLLISENSGFKKNDSTVNQLIAITPEIRPLILAMMFVLSF